MRDLLKADFPPLNELSPLTFAFMGDGVYEMLVREYLIGKGNAPVKKLHSRAVEWVRCEAQASALDSLSDILTEEEKTVVLRGRNAHVGHVPKNSQPEDYHAATALETLFGWLYIKGEHDRIRELFLKIIENSEAEHG